MNWQAAWRGTVGAAVWIRRVLRDGGRGPRRMGHHDPLGRQARGRLRVGGAQLALQRRAEGLEHPEPGELQPGHPLEPGLQHAGVGRGQLPQLPARRLPGVLELHRRLRHRALLLLSGHVGHRPQRHLLPHTSGSRTTPAGTSSASGTSAHERRCCAQRSSRPAPTAPPPAGDAVAIDPALAGRPDGLPRRRCGLRPHSGAGAQPELAGLVVSSPSARALESSITAKADPEQARILAAGPVRPSTYLRAKSAARRLREGAAGRPGRGPRLQPVGDGLQADPLVGRLPGRLHLPGGRIPRRPGQRLDRCPRRRRRRSANDSTSRPSSRCTTSSAAPTRLG